MAPPAATESLSLDSPIESYKPNFAVKSKPVTANEFDNKHVAELHGKWEENFTFAPISKLS